MNDTDRVSDADIAEVLRWATPGKYSLYSVPPYAAVAALCREVQAARRQQRWVPVGERLPKPNVRVLVAFREGREGIEIDEHMPDAGGWSEGITHWMPLPPPPTPEAR